LKLKSKHDYHNTANDDVEKLEELIELDDQPNDSGGNLPKYFKLVKLGSFIINLGLMIMLSSTGAIAIQQSDIIDDTGIIFIGTYMVIFALIFSVFDVL
jgi:NADH:ubiquinone oxidoreductase subunit 2 (subunit N)